MFPNRNIIGFHQIDVPTGFKYDRVLPDHLPPLICFSASTGLKAWNEIDLSSCKDDYIPPSVGGDGDSPDKSTDNNEDDSDSTDVGEETKTTLPEKHQGALFFF